MPYIPGSPIDGYCSECRADVGHVVLEAVGTQIRVVRCDKCGREGPFKSPRAKTKAALLEAAQRKKAPSSRKSTRTSKAPPTPPPEEVYRQLMESRDLSSAVSYSVKNPLELGDLVKHPSFGYGIVTSLADTQKAKILFEEGERMMACNRK